MMGIEFFAESGVTYGNAPDAVKDLNLTFIARNMANENYGDVPYVLEILQHPLITEEDIEARQKTVMTACAHAPIVYELRKLLVGIWEELDAGIKAVQDSRGKHLMEQTVIGIHVDTMRRLITGLRQIHEWLQRNRDVCENTSFAAFSNAFYQEEPEELLEEQMALILHLDDFKDKGEIFLSAEVGEGFSLREADILAVSQKARRVAGGLFSGRRPLMIADEEVYQSGVVFANQVILQLLGQCLPFLLRWQGLLYDMMRQTMFLAGCAGLYRRGREYGLYFCLPDRDAGQAENLYELSLGLQDLTTPIPNTAGVTKYRAVVVTGANQGGKSTFLRSMGIAQVMCQAGMYVPAKSYPLHAYRDLFTHFTRREDVTMNMGKFEEELRRMEEILRGAKKNTLLLLNESFATTTEVTAFQIMTDLTHACMENDITLWIVTHITKYAKELYREKNERILFLSAGRQAEGEIRFKMYEKAPGDTSYGLELYDEMIRRKR